MLVGASAGGMRIAALLLLLSPTSASVAPDTGCEIVTHFYFNSSIPAAKVDAAIDIFFKGILAKGAAAAQQLQYYDWAKGPSSAGGAIGAFREAYADGAHLLQHVGSVQQGLGMLVPLASATGTLTHPPMYGAPKSQCTVIRKGDAEHDCFELDDASWKRAGELDEPLFVGLTTVWDLHDAKTFRDTYAQVIEAAKNQTGILRFGISYLGDKRALTREHYATPTALADAVKAMVVTGNEKKLNQAGALTTVIVSAKSGDMDELRGVFQLCGNCDFVVLDKRGITGGASAGGPR